MSLKKLFNVLKNEGIVVPKLDAYLLSCGAEEDEDRGHGWNSPSSVSRCPRELFYSRTGVRSDGLVQPRLRRIFDNGHHVHDRLQTYLKKQGMLLVEETPVWDTDLCILGHSDGIIKINELSLGILEIKSINDNGFKSLIAAKPEHIEQAQVYMMCIEKLRVKLSKAKTKPQFEKLKKSLLKEYGELMDGFVVDGRRFSKKEKIAHKLNIMSNVMDILWECQKKIDTMVLLYEDKDNQELKEFVVKWDDALVEEITEKYNSINYHVENEILPPRPEQANVKSCNYCRYCDYKLACWK